MKLIRVSDYDACVHISLLRLREPYKSLINDDIHRLLIHYTDDVLCEKCTVSRNIPFIKDALIDIDLVMSPSELHLNGFECVLGSWLSHYVIISLELCQIENTFPVAIDVLFMDGGVWRCPPNSPFIITSSILYNNPKGLSRCKHGRDFVIQFRAHENKAFNQLASFKARLKIYYK